MLKIVLSYDVPDGIRVENVKGQRLKVMAPSDKIWQPTYIEVDGKVAKYKMRDHGGPQSTLVYLIVTVDKLSRHRDVVYVDSKDNPVDHAGMCRFCGASPAWAGDAQNCPRKDG